MTKFFLRFFGLSFALMCCNIAVAQDRKAPNPDAVSIAQQYLKKQQTEWKLTDADLLNAKLDYAYPTEATGVTHVYFIQSNAGIELENAIANVNIMPDGSVLIAGNRFVTDLAHKVSATQASITPAKAIENAILHLRQLPTKITFQREKAPRSFVFREENISTQDISARLRYEYVNNTDIKLVWQVEIAPNGDQDYWHYCIDAVTGEVAMRRSMTTKCNFGENAFGRVIDGSEDCETAKMTTPQYPTDLNALNSSNLIGGGTYNVFALPLESPSHGARTLVTDPADSLGSPYGWHDTNGAAGPEFTITRGNNVHAYLDWANNSTPSQPEPNGGALLNFDYSFNAAAEPDSNRLTAQVNLFYMNNMLHDILYRYGFDERSGNFQSNNYGRGGLGGDWVRAEAQDALRATPPGTNNANMSTPADGAGPRMQMYTWTARGADKLVHITSPASLVGDYDSQIGGFGGQITNTPLNGQLELVNDGSANPTFACGTLTQNLTGKIAMIDRGVCLFVDKVKKVQQRGATACIVCNIDNTTISMGGTDATITIPAIMMKKVDCDRIKAQLAGGVAVSLYTTAAAGGPAQLDGDFDNGIIAHELTHGVSNRLTGGPNNASCLANAEQMGEGWSDFIALAVTTRATDRGTSRRPIGTYVQRENTTTGNGIRIYPYTTDMALNPHSYDDITTNPEVHDLGEVWATMLWDLYWKMVDTYGFDINWRNVNSGNGRAIRLVMDGMKLQPCSPGFIDGRNAILAADRAAFNGANQCLIWDVFARRGLGFSAVQGSSALTYDNQQSFERAPFCDKTLKFEKNMPETANPNTEITVSLRLRNYKDSTLTNLVITDPIPANATFVAGSASSGGTFANNTVTFNIASMRSFDTLNFSYRLLVGSNRSTAIFYDGLEAGDRNWAPESSTLTPNGGFWTVDANNAVDSYRGASHLLVGDATAGKTDTRMPVVFAMRVPTTQPVLRFYHKHTTETSFDGGMVEVSTNNGTTWTDVGAGIFRNPYRGPIAYGVLAIPNLRAFSGAASTYRGSYVDLSAYAGQNIKFRFRFVADSTQPANFASSFWRVDDIMLMDMVNLNSIARVTSTQGDNITTTAASRGTCVEPLIRIDVKDLELGGVAVKVYPNPVGEMLNIAMETKNITSADISITDAVGRVVMTQRINTTSGNALVPVSTENWAAGIYFVQVRTEQGIKVAKVVKQ